MAKRDWVDDASCLGIPTDMFFPSNRTDPAVIKLCNGCPVKQQCLQEAMHEERNDWSRFGIRGGLSAIQRTKLAKGLAKERAA